MTCKTDDVAEGLSKRLLECLEELDDLKVDLDIWTDSLEELSDIVGAFKVDKKNNIQEKTVLDVGTDCVKPLYIALKFEPQKIIGINEDLSSYSFASDIEQKSKLLTKTEIKLYDCSCFDKENLDKILAREKQTTSDFILLSKTLHHLRTGECIAKERDQNHKCSPDEESCIYEFKEQKIFNMLLQLGKRVIVYEWFDASEEDDDKVRGRGGYFTTEEWRQIFRHLSENYRVEFIKPLKYRLTKSKLKKIESKLRQVDRICFYVEAK
jgi:predicted RNA methylase